MTAAFHFFFSFLLCQDIGAFLFHCGTANRCPSQCHKEQNIFLCLCVWCQGSFLLFSFYILLPRSLLNHINKLHLCTHEGHNKKKRPKDVRCVSVAVYACVCVCNIIISNKWQHGKKSTGPRPVGSNRLWIHTLQQTSNFSNKLPSVAKSVIFLGPLWNSAVWLYSHKIYLSHAGLCLLFCFARPACFLVLYWQIVPISLSVTTHRLTGTTLSLCMSLLLSVWAVFALICVSLFISVRLSEWPIACLVPALLVTLFAGLCQFYLSTRPTRMFSPVSNWWLVGRFACLSPGESNNLMDFSETRWTDEACQGKSHSVLMWSWSLVIQLIY